MEQVIFRTPHIRRPGMDSDCKKNSEAILDLSRGDIPQDFEIYGVGNPAGELGSLSDEFVIQAGKQPFEHLGMLYASFINTLQHQQSVANTHHCLSSGGCQWGQTSLQLQHTP